MFDTNEFYNYLTKKKYTQRTVESYIEDVSLTVLWCKEHKRELDHMTYDDTVKYLEHLQNTVAYSTATKRINSLRHYFAFLKQEYGIAENYIAKIKMRPVRNKTYTILSTEELERMYTRYSTYTPKYHHHHVHMNTVVAGLIIYQGLSPHMLNALRLSHLNLDVGQIYIPSTTRSNARNLTLSSKQLMKLYTYIEHVRPALGLEHHSLLFGNTGVRNAILHMNRYMKKHVPNYKNHLQVRHSVISHWVQEFGIRNAQYMAGHVKVKSTERYMRVDIERLRKGVEDFHLFG